MSRNPSNCAANAVHFSNQKSSLVDVEVVVLGIRIKDGPFFCVAELHVHIGAVFIEDFVVDVESRFVGASRERERAPRRDRTGANSIGVELSTRVGLLNLLLCGGDIWLADLLKPQFLNRPPAAGALFRRT